MEKFKNQISFVGIGIIIAGLVFGNWLLVLIGVLLLLIVALVGAMF